MDKKAMDLGGVVVEVLIAVLVVGVLFLLIWSMIKPNYDEADEIAKSYFERFLKEIEIADSGGVGSFVMLDRGGGDFEDYLVYVGGALGVKYNGKYFSPFQVGENLICVCYVKKGENSRCKYCTSLDFPIVFEGNSEDGQIFFEGDSLAISKKGGFYEFVKR